MDGEIWDEERWEAFLEENDKRIEHYMMLLFRFMGANPPRGREGSRDRQSWERELRDFLLSNGLSPDDVLPRLLARDWDSDGLADESESSLGAGGEREDDFHDIQLNPVHERAQRLAGQVLRWSNELPGHVKDSTLVQFCSHIVQIPSNLAKGHGIGYEMEMLGGNIACAKRALSSANSALDLLREVKSAPYMKAPLYRIFYEECYELRNEIGVYVQELRGRFDLGID